MNGTENKPKRLLKEGKRVSAAWLQSGNPIMAEIVARCGFDVVMIDMEHGPGDILTLISQVQACQCSASVPFARAPWNDLVAIKRILDAGVYGLLVPYVNSAEEARAAVAAAKYPPLGVRGIAGSPRAAGFGYNQGAYFKAANDEIFVMTAVETPEAASNLDAILSVEGLDGIFIGPMDLATSMGYLGDPSAAPVKAAIEEIERKVFASGKILATVGGSWADAKSKYEKGYRLIVSMSDTVTLAQAARERADAFRKDFPER
jgi:2-dehydro-3-deoxyglucarate aldolase/4-hydroxy-2-oxoheptanedioate aldolase